MKNKKTTPTFGIHFYSEWSTADIRFTFFCLDIATEQYYPYIYFGFMGFILEIGYEAHM